MISVNATLDMTPQIINPEEKTCTLPGGTTDVSWSVARRQGHFVPGVLLVIVSVLLASFKVKYCLKASGRGAPASLSE